MECKNTKHLFMSSRLINYPEELYKIMTSSDKQVLAYTLIGSTILGLPYFIALSAPTSFPTRLNEIIAFISWSLILGVLLYRLDLQKTILKVALPASSLIACQILLLLSQSLIGKGTPYLGITLSTVWGLYGALLCLVTGAHLQAYSKVNMDSQLLLRSGIGMCMLVGTVQVIFGWLQYLELNLSLPFISLLSSAGRVYGNLRQPNLYALLVIVFIATNIWVIVGSSTLSRGMRVGLYIVMVMSVGAVVLSASRIGMVLIFAMAIWGVFEWRKCKSASMILISTLIWFFLFRALFMLLDRLDVLAFYGSIRSIAVSAAANSDRLNIWTAAIALIEWQPIFGIGFDKFAQSLFIHRPSLLLPTPFPLTVHTENPHNLFLQWALDFGLIFASILIFLLALSFWKCRFLLATLSGRVVLFVLFAPLAHSMVEYPLNYSFFLFPWCFLLGVAIVKSTKILGDLRANGQLYGTLLPKTEDIKTTKLVLAPFILAMGTLFAVFDFSKVQPLYENQDAARNFERLETGYKSVLYQNLADYAAVSLWPPTAAASQAQFAIAHRVSAFRLDSIVTPHYFQVSALTGKSCLAKAIAYRTKLADAKVYQGLLNIVENTTSQEIKSLSPYFLNPTPIEWPVDESNKC